MNKKSSLEELKTKVQDWLDVRPDEKKYRIAREIFTDKDIFDLEMELIFENTWIFACHESQIPNNNDFYTMRAGRQSLIVTRDNKGDLNAMLNACQHRGATLTRVCRGNQSTFTCPFHAWCYKSNGDLAKVKAPNEYHKEFNKKEHGLKKALISSYKGFVYVNLNTQSEETLEEFLGDAKLGFDMLIAQSPDGQLEVLPGRSSYTYDGNWKLQNENGLDGYHVSTVHYNYVATAQHRQHLNAEEGSTLDYSKLGAGDADTDDGWFAFKNGHSMLFSDMPNPSVRPGYKAVMPRLIEEYGNDEAEWMMHRLRNLNIYPSGFLMDQISSQLRIVRPVAWNKTEVHSFCIAVKGEADSDRENRIRQFEDFFNVSGMGTPDDLTEFREAQIGFEARLEPWSDISRGCDHWSTEPTANTEILGISPVLTGTEFTHEGLFVNQHQAWQRYLLDGLEEKIKLEGEGK